MNTDESIESINVKLTKLANLKKKLEQSENDEVQKDPGAVRLRPNSLEIISRLSPEERRIYLQISKIRNEWLGEV